MAKRRSSAANIAGLAALGALGYQMLKGKGKGDEGAPVVEASKPVAAEAPEDDNYDAGADGVFTTGTTRSMSRPSTPKALTQNPAPTTDLRDREAGMSRGTRATSTAGAGRGGVNPASVQPSQPLRDREAGMSRGTRPDFREPVHIDAEAGMSRGTRRTSMAGAGRGVVNPELVNPNSDFRRFRAGDVDPDTLLPTRRKAGGAVKKMAKGGAVKTSSNTRGDGIATKGKTRGKLY